MEESERKAGGCYGRRESGEGVGWKRGIPRLSENFFFLFHRRWVSMCSPSYGDSKDMCVYIVGNIGVYVPCVLMCSACIYSISNICVYILYI